MDTPAQPATSALLVLAAVLAGCVTGPGHPADAYFLDTLRVGATIHVVVEETGFSRQWEMKGVEDTINQYGLVERVAVFSSPVQESTYSLASRAFLLNKVLPGDYLEGGQRCSFPGALDIVVLLAGAAIPMRVEQQEVQGALFSMAVDWGDDRSLRLELTGKSHSTISEIEKHPSEAGEEIRIRSQLVPGPDCGLAEEGEKHVTFRNGSGAEVPMLRGYAPIPFRVDPHVWPPAGDLPGAGLSLHRAAARLELDPLYQVLKGDSDPSPHLLRYGSRDFCSTEFGWGWEIHLSGEADEGMRACVVIPKGVESAPLETVKYVLPSTLPSMQPEATIVPLHHMQSTVEAFSGYRAGVITDVELWTISPDSIARHWTSTKVLLRLEDPDTPAYRYECSFFGSTGALMYCYHGRPVHFDEVEQRATMGLPVFARDENGQCRGEKVVRACLERA